MPTFRSKEEFDRYIRDLVQGAASQPFSIESMCHCLNVNLPHWYKIPKFQKFNGKGDPQHHLRLFVNETLPVRDNKDNKPEESIRRCRNVGWEPTRWKLHHIGRVGSQVQVHEPILLPYQQKTYHIGPPRHHSRA